jgi:hypothetical protein
MRTRLCDNIVQAKEFTDGTIRYLEKSRTFVGAVTIRKPTTTKAQIEQGSEPVNLEEAMSSPGWRKTMEEEYSALIKNET